LISSKTAQKLIDAGIDPFSSLEDLITKIENLGYHGISWSPSAKGYEFTITYKDNTYVLIRILASNRKEAIARALLISDFPE
jgi:hypothetical protein